ncbi:DUF732 domain-containing protein [Streptomyces sp. NPDC088789]|uniref:DUF732 domain-containing protein n=1 Tax=Streptomyces sp. NPDC088789 TaxID=3365899 RepID=UPI00380C1464
MSHQPPHQQPPGWGTPPQPHQQQPWSQPPPHRHRQAPQPKKGPPKAALIGCGGVLVLLVLVGIIGVALDGDDTDAKRPTAQSSAPELTEEERASIDAAAGLPPEPDATDRARFLDALDAIDPRIVKPGKDDQAVSRGRNQCSSIKSSGSSREKLAQMALERFTVTTRLPEISTPQTGEKILDAVHTHLCPDF